MKREAKNTNSELLTISEVARQLRVDATTVRRWITAGALEAIVLPHGHRRRSYRIRRADLDKIINSNIAV